MLRSLGHGDRVITNSAFVRDDVLADGIVSPDRIHVVPLAGAMLDVARDSARRAELQQRALMRARRFT